MQMYPFWFGFSVSSVFCVLSLLIFCIMIIILWHCLSESIASNEVTIMNNGLEKIWKVMVMA